MTKMVQLSDEAYRRLKREKLPGESFSDVVLRRFPGGSIRDIFGIITEEEAQEAHRTIQEIDAYSREQEEHRLRERGLL